MYQGPHPGVLWVCVGEREELVERGMVQLLKGHKMPIIFPQEVPVVLLVEELQETQLVSPFEGLVGGSCQPQQGREVVHECYGSGLHPGRPTTSGCCISRDPQNNHRHSLGVVGLAKFCKD